MGMYYLGPVDGHDIGKLETVIRWARELRKPVLVHVVTKKGKGYKYAEEHPEKSTEWGALISRPASCTTPETAFLQKWASPLAGLPTATVV